MKSGFHFPFEFNPVLDMAKHAHQLDPTERIRCPITFYGYPVGLALEAFESLRRGGETRSILKDLIESLYAQEEEKRMSALLSQQRVVVV